MVFGYEWSQRASWRDFPKAALATWPLWLPFLPTLLASQQAKGSFDYGPRALWVKWVFWKEALRDRVRYVDYATTVLLLVAPAVAAWFKRLDGRLGWAGLIHLLLSLVVPRHLGGGDLADLRLIAVGLMLLALAIDWRPRPWPLMWTALGPFIVRMIITASVWTVHSANVGHMMKALDYIPRGAKVAVAVREEISLWAQPLYGHLGTYATTRRDALVNNHFAIPGVHMLTLTPAAWKWVDPSQRVFAAGVRRVDLSRFKPAAEADYLWYFGKYPPKKVPDGARLLFQTKHSQLYRLVHPAAPAALPAAPSAPPPAPPRG
jgi:hypothetical protein